MAKKKTRNRSVKVASVIVAILFIVAFALLIFALVSRSNSDISLFGYRFYYVLTGSMEPQIEEGSFIIVKETPLDSLEVGDVISFKTHDPDIEGQIVSHSIYSIDVNEHGVTELTTKGAANQIPDDYKVYEEDIKGKVVFDSRRIGSIFETISDRRVSFCITVLPILIIVIINMVDLFVLINTTEKHKDD